MAAPVVEAPLAHLLDHLLDRALLDAGLTTLQVALLLSQLWVLQTIQSIK